MSVIKRKAKKWIHGLLVVFMLCGLVALAGCGGDPQKPAGPGGERMQPYNPGDGTYK